MTLWIVVGVLAIMLVSGAIGALIAHCYVRQPHVAPAQSISTGPTPPEQHGPTHVMPPQEIRARVEQKYRHLPPDRQQAIATEIQRTAAGLIPGAKPRPRHPH